MCLGPFKYSHPWIIIIVCVFDSEQDQRGRRQTSWQRHRSGSWTSGHQRSCCDGARWTPLQRKHSHTDTQTSNTLPKIPRKQSKGAYFRSFAHLGRLLISRGKSLKKISYSNRFKKKIRKKSKSRTLFFEWFTARLIFTPSEHYELKNKIVYFSKGRNQQEGSK